VKFLASLTAKYFAISTKNTWQTQNQYAMQPQNASQAHAHVGYAHASKRPNSGDARLKGPNQQRLNHLAHGDVQGGEEAVDYQQEAEAKVGDVEDNLKAYDHVNF